MRVYHFYLLCLMAACCGGFGLRADAQPALSDQPSSVDLGPAAQVSKGPPGRMPAGGAQAVPDKLPLLPGSGVIPVEQVTGSPDPAVAAVPDNAVDAFLKGARPSLVEDLPPPAPLQKDQGKQQPDKAAPQKSPPQKSPPPSLLPPMNEKDRGKPLPSKVRETAQDQEISNLKLGFYPEMMPIDLAAALKLGGVRNLQILISRQRVSQAVAERQYAVAQILPSLNLGTSYDDHAGNLQQSSGNVLNVNRNAVYFGAGAYAIAAGTVNIPGVVWNLNVSETVFNALIARQFVEQMRFANRAMENEMLRRIAVAYTNLLRAEGRRALTLKIREEAREVYKITSVWAKAGAGREADKQRAAAELANRETDVFEAEGEVLQASSRLAELLNLDPATRLHVSEERVVPEAVVPAVIPLPDLLAIALLNRPELQERRAAIQKALLALQGSKLLPFSPNLIIGLSYGGEGGGSDLITPPTGTTPFAGGAPRFGNYAERLDFDAVGYWTLQNAGITNVALIRQAQSQFQTSNFQFLAQLDNVRAQVATAYAASHARFAQIKSAEDAVKNIKTGYELDFKRIFNGVGRPVELLNSLRLLIRSRLDLLEYIIAYNQAQLDLYVALGQPPPDLLARELPPGYGPPARPPANTEQPKDGR